MPVSLPNLPAPSGEPEPPSQLLRPCLDGCGRLTDHRRCPDCAGAWNAARDAARGTSSQRGYGTEWRTIRARILIRDGHRCHWCGRWAGTVDHVKAKADGGTDDDTNLVAACGPCNSSRGGTTAQLRRES
ncbi:HNH endonuclease [Frankia sp. Cr1]|uniref:HNH endonuclease n=1 Tax=Frankia sp. Cr1 TaxID=3073931 RepID=UPI002AD431FF|nr:HNH endonuclease [Frankia sp. Cr1]